MRITLMSDIHIEFRDKFTPTNPGSDVLILSGDIFVIDYLTRNLDSPYHALALDFLDFIDRVCKEWKHVIYICGNHEFYYGRIDTHVKLLRQFLSYYENLHILDNQSVIIDGIKFVGSTMWTDANKKDPMTIHHLGERMNDFRLISWKSGPRAYQKLKVSETVHIHERSVEYLKSEISGYDGKVVVCTHHAPCVKSIHPRYKGDYHANGGYYSDLSELMLDNPNIAIWTHGHTHDSFSYEIGETRVIANPKGYKDENKNFCPNFMVDI